MPPMRNQLPVIASSLLLAQCRTPAQRYLLSEFFQLMSHFLRSAIIPQPTTAPVLKLRQAEILFGFCEKNQRPRYELLAKLPET